MNAPTLTATVAAALLVSTAVPAQLTQQQIHAAGLGAQTKVIDVEAVTNNDLMLGVVYLNGEFFVTGAQTTREVFVLDGDGNLKRKFTQATTSSFGWRDGATDGKSLMFGWEQGINVIDINGNPVNTVIAANGPQTITQPIKAPTSSGVSTHRAVAYNPKGNNGNGSIWTANFGSPLIEIDLTGKVLTRYTNGSSWSLYGLAWDPMTETLLGNSVPNAGGIAQIDPASGKTTGASFPRNAPGSAQGGLSPVVMPGQAGGDAYHVVGLDQADSDTITVYRVHLYSQPPRVGYDEARLSSAADGGTLNDDPIKTMKPGSELSFRIGGDFVKNPSWILLNAGKDALTNGSTQLGRYGLPELVALSQWSDPMGAGVLLAAFGEVTVKVDAPNLMDGEFLRAQGITVNPGGISALTATNQQFFKMDASKVTVEAVGSNSFNSNRASGFFRVIHNVGPAITSVQFDWKDSTNTRQATMRFDTNQTGMNDRFDGGNSQLSTCEGTYRNGSDVATGLVYAGTPAAACDANANTGWMGTNPGNAGDFKTLTFAFSGGKFAGNVFEFDADTDGGAGINGGAMTGMVVTIKLADNTTLKGEIKTDPNNNLRSFIRFL